jgi:hypothetical protein
MSAERNGGDTRLLAVTEVLGDGEKHPPIIATRLCSSGGISGSSAHVAAHF